MNDLPPIATPAIAVFNPDDGALIHIGPWDSVPDGLSWTPLPTGYNQSSWSWNTAARMMVEDPSKVEAQLVAIVKSEAERRKMRLRSPGDGKDAEYRQKRSEALASVAIPQADLGALPDADAREQYPAASMERLLTGETLAAVLARYLTASNLAESEVYRLAAIEHAGVARIMAAESTSKKRAAYQAIDWFWQPA
ncbi:hypothetical protein [Sphingomonas mucosissima]|uniref:Uncharacterized protein n=1 Tax=Sphingomonas mucosissima TaxID=370959 RepID=A0A245ZRD4_9SPHN|nr:hypothetical protein [Sphingomonas mucosissima]OWK32302.1 hypothetical protein SPMU_06240 [Sphingomonas mucosissima]